jgi:DNA repair protein RadD
MEPRPHQIKALNDIWEAMQYENNVLLEAPCSFGKTIVLAKIIQRLLRENENFRVLVLTDREILVTQTRDKLIQVAPELIMDVGIVCASVSKDKNHEKRVTIASRQSLINRLNDFEPVQLTIIDEVHLLSIPKKDKPPTDQFSTIIDTLYDYNDKMRLLGVTATPYRLNDGYIYGDKNSPGCIPRFSQVHHRATVAEIQALGYLAPLVGKTIDNSIIKSKLDNLSLVAGEFNLFELNNLMSQGVHIQSAVETWKEYASDRKKTIAFCVTIEHAECLAKAFNSQGIKALTIHSKQDDLFQTANMQALINGDGKVFCSVAKLTTGLDVPDIDCLLLLRPTKSTALYKQCLGRPQRIAPGKTDALILDLVGNNDEFGTDLDKLRVKYKRSVGGGEKPKLKECPECYIDLHPAVRVCPECGYEYPRDVRDESDKPDMVDVKYESEPPKRVEVFGMYTNIHESKKTKNELLKIRLQVGDEVFPKEVNLWLCFPDDGYNGYAVQKGRNLWSELTMQNNYPESACEAKERENELIMPTYAVIDFNPKYPEIKELILDIPF